MVDRVVTRIVSPPVGHYSQVGRVEHAAQVRISNQLD